MEQELIQVGRVVATEAKPSTAYSFSFWAADGDNKVGIGTLVVVKKDDLEVYGVVVEGFGFTDLNSAMHDYIGSEGDPGSDAPTMRHEVKCYNAAVLRVTPEEPLQPVPVGPVYLADDISVRTALRMDTFWEKSGIPVGLYQNGDLLSPVYLDSEFLLGPESAHLNITGVSGLRPRPVPSSSCCSRSSSASRGWARTASPWSASTSRARTCCFWTSPAARPRATNTPTSTPGTASARWMTTTSRCMTGSASPASLLRM